MAPKAAWWRVARAGAVGRRKAAAVVAMRPSAAATATATGPGPAGALPALARDRGIRSPVCGFVWKREGTLLLVGAWRVWIDARLCMWPAGGSGVRHTTYGRASSTCIVSEYPSCSKSTAVTVEK